jgi:hypothetical protein
MKLPKHVMVSPDYNGGDWWDSKSKLWFKKSDGIIELPENIKDPTNIHRYIRFNYLNDMTEYVVASPPPITNMGPIVATANQILNQQPEIIEKVVEKVVEEVVQEDEKECPWCHGKFSTKGITSHKRFCKKNPYHK